MNKEIGKEREGFKVECSWCEAIIRRDNVKDSHGMCLKCYARMLSEYNRTYQQGRVPRWSSNR